MIENILALKSNVISPAEAVNQSVNYVLRNPGTSGATALARVLLHAYSHGDQPLDIADLCVLDEIPEHWAWVILKTRVDGIEPQDFAGNRDAFDQIVKDYWQTPHD